MSIKVQLEICYIETLLYIIYFIYNFFSSVSFPIFNDFKKVIRVTWERMQDFNRTPYSILQENGQPNQAEDELDDS